jgi:hypothetical protein
MRRQKFGVVVGYVERLVYEAVVPHARADEPQTVAPRQVHVDSLAVDEILHTAFHLVDKRLQFRIGHRAARGGGVLPVLFGFLYAHCPFLLIYLWFGVCAKTPQDFLPTFELFLQNFDLASSNWNIYAQTFEDFLQIFEVFPQSFEDFLQSFDLLCSIWKRYAQTFELLPQIFEVFLQNFQDFLQTFEDFLQTFEVPTSNF